MQQRFYLDTSIWLDFFENRNEPNFPKGDWAKELLEKIVKDTDQIIYSDLTIIELQDAGYPIYQFDELIRPFSQILGYIETEIHQLGKAKDLAVKRDVPTGDALHAILARDSNAFLITFDTHFRKLLDITKPHTPQEFI